MNISFEWPPFVGAALGFLASAATLLIAMVGAVLLVRRLILAWRHWGQTPALGAFASRADLLHSEIRLVGLREARRIGRVNDVILNLETGRVAGFRVGFWRKRLLPFSRVKNIGRDVITVDSADDLRLPAEEPILDRLAAAKYRWHECEVVAESGLRLGTTSWRQLWYHRTDGNVELNIESSPHSPIDILLAWAIELASLPQPLDDWIGRPGRLSARIPLPMVRSTSRAMVILNSQGEALFHQAMLDEARRTRESIDRSLAKVKFLARWRKRESPRALPESVP